MTCPALSCTLASLEPNSTYAVRVVGVNSAGTSETAEVEVATLSGRPAEIGLSLADSGKQSLSLEWDAQENVSGVALEWIDIEFAMADSGATMSERWKRLQRRGLLDVAKDALKHGHGSSEMAKSPVQGTVRISSRRTGMVLGPL